MSFKIFITKIVVFLLIDHKVQEPKTLAEAVAEAERTIARQNSAIDMVTEDDASVRVTLIVECA